MMKISQDLREQAKGYDEAGISINPWLACKAADTIDALVAALEEARVWLAPQGVPDRVYREIDAALTLARGEIGGV